MTAPTARRLRETARTAQRPATTRTTARDCAAPVGAQSRSRAVARSRSRRATERHERRADETTKRIQETKRRNK